jgi:hypothetical protein
MFSGHVHLKQAKVFREKGTLFLPFPMTDAVQQYQCRTWPRGRLVEGEMADVWRERNRKEREGRGKDGERRWREEWWRGRERERERGCVCVCGWAGKEGGFPKVTEPKARVGATNHLEPLLFPAVLFILSITFSDKPYMMLQSISWVLIMAMVRYDPI